MNRLLSIKGFTAAVQYDPEIELFRGEFLGLRGGADFYAPDEAELHTEGERSLRVFLRLCAEDGAEPRRDFTGRIALEVSPDLHERLSVLAEASGRDLQDWLREILQQKAAEEGSPPRPDGPA
jgi:predicted HicB family RNase H-like nuclease